jgi:hypothetical protein
MMRDIVASQSGHEVISLQKMDSLLLFLNVTEKLRMFLRRNARGIWIIIHLNPKAMFLISNLVPCCKVTSIFYLSSSVLNERATIKPWSNIELGKFLVCSKL